MNSDLSPTENYSFDQSPFHKDIIGYLYSMCIIMEVPNFPALNLGQIREEKDDSEKGANLQRTGQLVEEREGYWKGDTGRNRIWKDSAFCQLCAGSFLPDLLVVKTFSHRCSDNTQVPHHPQEKLRLPLRDKSSQGHFKT